ncbi:hypothetical protein ACLB2K_029700 [Fragaria x ananassa]
MKENRKPSCFLLSSPPTHCYTGGQALTLSPASSRPQPSPATDIRPAPRKQSDAKAPIQQLRLGTLDTTPTSPCQPSPAL